jgi:hypothetical protein
MRVTSYWFYPLQSHSHWFGWGLAGEAERRVADAGGGWRAADPTGAGGRRVGTGVVIVGGMDYEGAEATPRYRKVVDGAAELAREMGHSYVGVEHLFLAIIRDRGAVPTQALGKLADLDRVEAGLLEVMASASYRGQAPPAELLGGGAGAGTTDRSEEKGF